MATLARVYHYECLSVSATLRSRRPSLRPTSSSSLPLAPSSPHQSSVCVLLFSLINADFCVAGSLIAYGALLGKVSPVQLMVLTLFGVTLFAVEEYIILHLLHVSAAWLPCPTTKENVL